MMPKVRSRREDSGRPLTFWLGRGSFRRGAGGIDQAGFYYGVADVVVVVGKGGEDFAA